MEAVQELGETSIMIIADAAEFIRHQFICIYAFVPDQYILSNIGKIFAASRQEKPFEITQHHKGTMKDENIRGRYNYLAHQWLKFQPNEREEDLRSVQ